MAAQRTANRRRRGPRLLAPLSLLMAARLAQAAAFAPGADADPPTGAVHVPLAPSAEEPLAGNGIDWRFAPWVVSGLLALDLRVNHLEDGQRPRSGLLEGQVDLASYLWQPWFAQVRLGMGVLVNTSDTETDSGNSLSLTGRAALSLFPSSRFPFELRADISDSRSDGLSLAADYRRQRYTALQSWRPVDGRLNLQMQLEQSTIETGGVDDRLTTFDATASSQLEANRLELTGNFSAHERSDDTLQTRIGTLMARHGFVPSYALQVDTMASWNQVRFEDRGLELGSEVRQLSSYLSWRLAEGELLGLPGMPLITGTARWVQSGLVGSDHARSEAVNASIGLNHEIGTDWRFGLSASAGRLSTVTSDSLTVSGLAAAVTWAPRLEAYEGWRYIPSVTLTGARTTDELQGTRQLAGTQLSHAITRDFALDPSSTFTFGFAQSLAVLDDSGPDEQLRGFSNGLNVSWTRLAESGGQSYVALTASDARTEARLSGSSQLVNLQWSQRAPINRFANWSINFTAQATRNDASEIDPFTGQSRTVSQDWLPFYSGGASYDHQRLFGVPRLRLSLLASANSQALERRAFGSIEAPTERVTASFEGRLEYLIGRLELRLAGRLGRVDGREVGVLQARAQRRF